MSHHSFIESLAAIVGRRHVITDERKTEPYRTGFRTGHGIVQAVVFPGTLVEQWRVLKACVAADRIVIMQAANTGLTGGSTPCGDDYDRDVVVINTRRLSKLLLLGQGEQIVSFPGATLSSLERLLAPIGRSPHSVIGSSCIGASIAGGVANSSGGALVKRGPAYTQLALFARINQGGSLELINHLDIGDLGADPETILANLEGNSFSQSRIRASNRVASDQDYENRVRDIAADSPARYNADTGRLFEASGCAGKVAIFALRLDTFPLAKEEQTFYLGTNDLTVLSELRADILTTFRHLPDMAEYMHRECFDVAETYGKDMFVIIRLLGMGAMPRLFRFKSLAHSILKKMSWLPRNPLDKLLQFGSRFLPRHLPPRILGVRDRYEHHVILKTSDEGIREAREYLANSCLARNDDKSGYVVCTPREGASAFLHRFVAAGAAMRYQAIHHQEVGEVLALDVALKRNDQVWFLPSRTESGEIAKALYYGHFLCHVFHQDFVLRNGANTDQVKETMLGTLHARGAKYPAEHNVGHVYEAEKGLADFYRTLDPVNAFNPGIGRSSKLKRWSATA